MSRKTFQELSLIDDYFSNAIASNEEINTDCYRLLLSVLLEKEIGQIHVIAQRMIPGTSPEQRGIRIERLLENT